ncbi:MULTISPECIES: RNA polymerase sigma factor [Pedobacter]|uniref:Sigma-70 family RNA polymerase sigma factor n=1 Tax=Pedobacter gandavensis TaxID=2679963 RepID=A0ABR6EVM3_9SPHI|nr:MULTISPECIES: sigma-70 family RNA polymerase sigma factor [Pedobacter]ALL05232.1 RNA polymerase subunit sigma-70 [Pedobacter sp. PACM 27299]MBB2149011.1 sigma-70 family RNA polymerase sigma factor [Pedobacter gandavensis]
MSNKLSSSVPTDREVVLGILNDSEDTLNKLYTGYFPMVLQFILNNNGDEDDAKDVYQEGIIVLYNKIKGGNFELSSKLKTYIYSVCRRIWLKKLSQESRKTNNISDFEDIMAVEVDLEQHEEKDQQFDKMNDALLHLGEPCKTIIQDFYINGLSMQDICEKFGYTNTDNAKTQKYKCLQRLKKLFFQV